MPVISKPRNSRPEKNVTKPIYISKWALGPGQRRSRCARQPDQHPYHSANLRSVTDGSRVRGRVNGLGIGPPTKSRWLALLARSRYAQAARISSACCINARLQHEQTASFPALPSGAFIELKNTARGSTDRALTRRRWAIGRLGCWTEKRLQMEAKFLADAQPPNCPMPCSIASAKCSRTARTPLRRWPFYDRLEPLIA